MNWTSAPATKALFWLQSRHSGQSVLQRSLQQSSSVGSDFQSGASFNSTAKLDASSFPLQSSCSFLLQSSGFFDLQSAPIFRLQFASSCTTSGRFLRSAGTCSKQLLQSSSSSGSPTSTGCSSTSSSCCRSSASPCSCRRPAAIGFIALSTAKPSLRPGSEFIRWICSSDGPVVVF